MYPGTPGSLEGQVNSTRMCWRDDDEGFKEEVDMVQELERLGCRYEADRG